MDMKSARRGPGRGGGAADKGRRPGGRGVGDTRGFRERGVRVARNEARGGMIRRQRQARAGEQVRGEGDDDLVSYGGGGGEGRGGGGSGGEETKGR